MTAATPDTDHLTLPQFVDKVYPPAEDTYLLLDALEQDWNTIIRPRNPTICLEIGSGSGCVSTFLAMYLGTPTLYLTTDINRTANDATRVTAARNSVAIDCINTDLTYGLMHRLRHSVDIIIFNPPYVPTPDHEVGSHELSAAWAGGFRGRRVIDRVIPLIMQLLSKQGILYFVLVEENLPDEIAKIMAEYGYDMTIVMKRRAGPERLCIARFDAFPLDN